MNITSLSIQIKNVGKHYGATTALGSIDLDIHAGEFVTLLGPSGSGKTTLLNIIAGFINPDHGSIHFGGLDVSFLPPHKRNLGMVFQNYALFPHMDVSSNVGFPLRARKVSKSIITERVKRSLKLVRLDGYGDRKVSELSGGQRQRVALARAVVFEPQIILMDEPLSALDKQLREEMQIELRHLHDTLGATTVYVTHDQREALTMSDRIAVLRNGNLEQFDSPQGLYDAPTSKFSAEFVGESTLLPVEVIDKTHIRLGSTMLRTEQYIPPNGKILIAIRSEKIFISNKGDKCENIIVGVVDEIVYQGDSIIVFVKLDSGGRVMVRQPARIDSNNAILELGKPVNLSLHPSHTILVPDEVKSA